MSSKPKLVRYSNGLFKLIKPNLPETVRKDREAQHKILLLLSFKYRSYNWGKMLPEERFKVLNDYVYSLVKDEYKD